MTIRDKVNDFINKAFEDYTLFDVVELSKLKLKLGQQAMQSKAKAIELDSKYRLKRAQLYREEKLMKCTDKMASENAFIGTESDRIDMEKAKAEADLKATYHRDLNDIVIAVRMCSRIYDAALNDKLEH